MPTEKHRLIVGISGASGALYGIRLLEQLQHMAIESHLVISPAAHITLAQETQIPVSDLQKSAHRCYNYKDIAAPIASGSFKTLGMVIAPCSIRTASEIASGVTSSLLTRAADVCLKERRRLVLMVRETPLHSGHLRTMLTLSDMGAVIAPPMPAFYSQPKDLTEMVDHNVGRVLDLFDLESPFLKRWQGLSPAQPAQEE